MTQPTHPLRTSSPSLPALRRTELETQAASSELRAQTAEMRLANCLAQQVFGAGLTAIDQRLRTAETAMAELLTAMRDHRQH